jgi:hypothetical protein
VRRPEKHQQERNQKENEPSMEKSAKQETKRQPTFNLLLLHLEGAALGLDRLLQVNDGSTLLLEGHLLIRTRNAEGYQLALEL